MQNITVIDKNFEIYLSETQIRQRIAELATALSQNYRDKNPLFVAVLNGGFIFAADIMRQLDFACEISFVKLTSYVGSQSTGKVKELIGLNENIAGRHVVVLEDIIDTGFTLQYLLEKLTQKQPASLEICTLLLKPEALKVEVRPTFMGFEVANRFLLGYGLDYDGQGRNLKHLYAESV